MRGRGNRPFHFRGFREESMRYIFLITGIRTAGVDTVYRLAVVRKSSVVDDLKYEIMSNSKTLRATSGILTCESYNMLSNMLASIVKAKESFTFANFELDEKTRTIVPYGNGFSSGGVLVALDDLRVTSQGAKVGYAVYNLESSKIEFIRVEDLLSAAIAYDTRGLCLVQNLRFHKSKEGEIKKLACFWHSREHYGVAVIPKKAHGVLGFERSSRMIAEGLMRRLEV